MKKMSFVRATAFSVGAFAAGIAAAQFIDPFAGLEPVPASESVLNKGDSFCDQLAKAGVSTEGTVFVCDSKPADKDSFDALSR